MVERGSFNRHPVALNDPPFSRFYYRGATAIIRQVHSTTSVMADDNLTKQVLILLSFEPANHTGIFTDGRN